MHEIEEKKGGSLEELRADCPPELLAPIFHRGFPIVKWHRLHDYQLEALRQIATATLNSLLHFG